MSRTPDMLCWNCAADVHRTYFKLSNDMAISMLKCLECHPLSLEEKRISKNEFERMEKEYEKTVVS